MFNLLIEKEMDDFLVTEARDALMLVAKEHTDLDEARKYVYRQILSFERKGWLVANGSARNKRYQKTDLFLQMTCTPRVAKSASTSVTHAPKSKEHKVSQSTELHSFEFTVLLKEKSQHEGELAIILGEVEEYQSLIKRFPNNRDAFLPLFSEAKERSARLLGKINALSKALKTSGTMVSSC